MQNGRLKNLNVIAMATVRFQGKTKVMFLPVTTSTAFTKNNLTTFTSGLLVAATSSTVPGALFGPIEKTIASTDSDYATARLVPVVMPVEKNVVWKQDFTTTLVATDLGAECDFTDAGNANRGASSIKACIPLSVISATQGLALVKIGGSY